MRSARGAARGAARASRGEAQGEAVTVGEAHALPRRQRRARDSSSHWVSISVPGDAPSHELVHAVELLARRGRRGGRNVARSTSDARARGRRAPRRSFPPCSVPSDDRAGRTASVRNDSVHVRSPSPSRRSEGWVCARRASSAWVRSSETTWTVTSEPDATRADVGLQERVLEELTVGHASRRVLLQQPAHQVHALARHLAGDTTRDARVPRVMLRRSAPGWRPRTTARRTRARTGYTRRSRGPPWRRTSGSSGSQAPCTRASRTASRPDRSGARTARSQSRRS